MLLGGTTFCETVNLKNCEVKLSSTQTKVLNLTRFYYITQQRGIPSFILVAFQKG